MKQFVIRAPEHGKAMVDYVKAHAGAQAAAGAPLVVSIDTYKARRSGEQNRLLHALLNDISEQATVSGKYFSAETWKELIRRKFIGCEEISLPDGTRFERGISTTSLSIGEFTILIDKVTAWAVTELGVDFS